MSTVSLRQLLPRKRQWRLLAALVLAALGLTAVAGLIWPEIGQLAVSAVNRIKPVQLATNGGDHAGEASAALDHGEAKPDSAKHENSDVDEHDHENEIAQAQTTYNHKHDEAAAIKLSQQARANIGLQLAKVELQSFERTVTVPGNVVERPGWSELEVTAPMTGVVTRIYPIQGEAVEPGQPLFDVRLTHEDLLQAQTEFLRTVEELDVIGREVARLEKVSADGVVAGKTLLERKYEQQKQEANLRAQRQALLLHGLSAEQVETIISGRTLLQSLTIRAPNREATAAPEKHPLQVEQLKVTQGKHVTAGDTLCTLADHHELYIEGQAFEQDMQTVNRAAAGGCNLSAVLGSKSTGDEQIVSDLCILYLDNKVDRESRTFHFYVALPNHVLREQQSPDGRRFVAWQFRPGQRTQLRIPVEQLAKRIVLPVEAVARDGVEDYVFEANDDHFDRRSVHIEYRDQESAVIADDGSLTLGGTVAASAAHQMQLALKNKSGGGVDPHAGHNH